MSEIASDNGAYTPALRHSMDMSGSFVQREVLSDENGVARTADEIRRTQSQHMDLEY